MEERECRELYGGRRWGHATVQGEPGANGCSLRLEGGLGFVFEAKRLVLIRFLLLFRRAKGERDVLRMV